MKEAKIHEAEQNIQQPQKPPPQLNSLQNFQQHSRLHFIGRWKCQCLAILDKAYADREARRCEQYGRFDAYQWIRREEEHERLAARQKMSTNRVNRQTTTTSSSSALASSTTALGVVVSSRRTQDIVIHLDMDAFFCAVALANPSNSTYRRSPVAIAAGTGNSDISSCNYLARSYGVRASMWMRQAKELCPDLVNLSYDFPRCEAINTTIYRLLLVGGLIPLHWVPGREFWLDVLSVDEFLLALDSTAVATSTANNVDTASSASSSSSFSEVQVFGPKQDTSDATPATATATTATAHSYAGRPHHARVWQWVTDEWLPHIRKTIETQTLCTCSCGVGPSILVARAATALAKPNGMYAVPRGAPAAEFIAHLAVKELHGVGRVTLRKLSALLAKKGLIEEEKNSEVDEGDEGNNEKEEDEEEGHVEDRGVVSRSRSRTSNRDDDDDESSKNREGAKKQKKSLPSAETYYPHTDTRNSAKTKTTGISAVRCSLIQQLSVDELQKSLGAKNGDSLFKFARGIDTRVVTCTAFPDTLRELYYSTSSKNATTLPIGHCGGEQKGDEQYEGGEGGMQQTTEARRQQSSISILVYPGCTSSDDATSISTFSSAPTATGGGGGCCLLSGTSAALGTKLPGSVGSTMNYAIRARQFAQLASLFSELAVDVCGKIGRHKAHCKSFRIQLLQRHPNAPFVTPKYLGCGHCVERNFLVKTQNFIEGGGGVSELRALCSAVLVLIVDSTLPPGENEPLSGKSPVLDKTYVIHAPYSSSSSSSGTATTAPASGWSGSTAFTLPLHQQQQTEQQEQEKDQDVQQQREHRAAPSTSSSSSSLRSPLITKISESPSHPETQWHQVPMVDVRGVGLSATLLAPLPTRTALAAALLDPKHQQTFPSVAVAGGKKQMSLTQAFSSSKRHGQHHQSSNSDGSPIEVVDEEEKEGESGKSTRKATNKDVVVDVDEANADADDYVLVLSANGHKKKKKKKKRSDSEQQQQQQVVLVEEEESSQKSNKKHRTEKGVGKQNVSSSIVMLSIDSSSTPSCSAAAPGNHSSHQQTTQASVNVEEQSEQKHAFVFTPKEQAAMLRVCEWHNSNIQQQRQGGGYSFYSDTLLVETCFAAIAKVRNALGLPAAFSMVEPSIGSRPPTHKKKVSDFCVLLPMTFFFDCSSAAAPGNENEKQRAFIQRAVLQYGELLESQERGTMRHTNNINNNEIEVVVEEADEEETRKAGTRSAQRAPLLEQLSRFLEAACVLAVHSQDLYSARSILRCARHLCTDLTLALRHDDDNSTNSRATTKNAECLKSVDCLMSLLQETVNRHLSYLASVSAGREGGGRRVGGSGVLKVDQFLLQV